MMVIVLLNYEFIVCCIFAGTYCIHNHPVSKVCVMGDVVLIDRRHNFIGYGGNYHINLMHLIL